MFDELQAQAEIINKDLVKVVSGKAVFEENAKAGRCIATFELRADAITVRPIASPFQITWTGTRNCADGAILEPTEQGINLHIIELKSVLDNEMFKKVLKQARGMFASAHVLGRLLGMHSFYSVRCYVVYTETRINFARTVDPVLLKTAVHHPDVIAAIAWSKRRIILPFGYVAPLRLEMRRQGEIEVDFGRI